MIKNFVYTRNKVVKVATAVQSANVILIVVMIESGFTKFGTTPGGGANAGSIASSAGVRSIFAVVDMYSAVVAKYAQPKVTNHGQNGGEQQWSNTIGALAHCDRTEDQQELASHMKRWRQD